MQDNRIAESLGYALVRSFRAINRETNRKVRPLGLSSEQAHILMVLWLEGPLKVGELQKLLGLSSGTLTGAIDRMEKAELVRRVADPHDGRAWRVEPAPMSKQKKRELEGAIEEIEEICFAVLSPAERKQLFGMLEKVTKALG
jgi:DNA-binding MarR family transcriptional regulator